MDTTDGYDNRWTVQMWGYRSNRLLSVMSFDSEARARHVATKGFPKFARHNPRAVLIDPSGTPAGVLASLFGGPALWYEVPAYRLTGSANQFCLPQYGTRFSTPGKIEDQDLDPGIATSPAITFGAMR